MTNYDDLPLFPLHAVLFPEMPLPLHIFEPRYREMIMRCREDNSPFGITLIGSGDETGAEAMPHQIGTTARITQYEELPDGRMYILVLGETRFQITRTHHNQPFLSAAVKPFGDEIRDAKKLKETAATVSELFKTYLQRLLAMTGQSLSGLQLPREPENLAYAIASVLQVPLPEKQSLLEMTVTEDRLTREMEILQVEIEAQNVLQDFLGAGTEGKSFAFPVNVHELGKLSSQN